MTAPTRQQVKQQTPTVSGGFEFGHALASEFKKIMTVRATIIWFILFTGCLYGPVVLQGLFTQDDQNMAWLDLTFGATIFILLAVVYGAGSTAGEISTHMQAHAIMTQKSRWNWLVARFLVSSAFILVSYSAGIALSYLAVLIMPKLHFVGSTMLPVVGNAGLLVFYAILAAGLAVVLRSRVAGLTLPLVWMLVVEQLLFVAKNNYKVAEVLYKISPGHSMMDLSNYVAFHYGDPNAQQSLQGMDLPGLNQIILVPLVWAAIAVISALIINHRRDVH